MIRCRWATGIISWAPKNGGSGWGQTEGGEGTKVAKTPMGLGVYEGRPAVDRSGAEPKRVGKEKGLGRPIRFAWLRRLTELKLHDMA